MASNANGSGCGSHWRLIGWGTAIALLALPFVAMQFTRDVNWSASDFVVFAAMLLGIGIPLELAVRRSRHPAYRAGAAAGLLGAFLVVWANLAVGIVGSENNPLNLLFFGALLVGIAGAIAARFEARGMARAMIATAVALGLAFAIALTGVTDEPTVSHGREALGTGMFAVFFLGSAWLFRRAGRD